MTHEQQIADIVIEAIKEAITPLIVRIAQLEAHQEVKVQDKGIWASGKVYEIGDLVTSKGAGWICRSTHFSTGTSISHDHFRLFAKSGRDNR